MRKIISGRRYDTDTAKNCGYNKEIVLFKKRNGEYFKRVKKSTYGMCTIWDEIVPISKEEGEMLLIELSR